MKAKSTSDVTEMPYESNPIDLIKPSYNAFVLMASEYLKLVAITLITYFILSIPAFIAFSSLHSLNAFATPSLAAIGLIFLSLVLISISGIYLSYALTKLPLAAARGVKLTWRQSLPKSFSEAWDVAWASLIAAAIIVLGLIALIIPGIIFAIRYSQVAYVVVDEGITGMAALRRSEELVAKRKMDMAGLFSLSQVVGIIIKIPAIGTIFLIIFQFITSPMYAIRFIQLTQLSDEDRKTIPTKNINYVLLVLAIIVRIVLASAKKTHK